jgi:hypothetical protein
MLTQKDVKRLFIESGKKQHLVKLSCGRYGLIAGLKESEQLRQLIPMQFDFIEYDCMSCAPYGTERELFTILFRVANSTPAKISKVNRFVSFLSSMKQVKTCCNL